MRYIFYFFTVLFLSASAPARGDTGTAALSFLKLDSGARAAAVGGAFTAGGSDVFGVFYNPALASVLPGHEIGLMHNILVEGIKQEEIFYAFPLDGKVSLFAGLNMLLSGSMDGYAYTPDGPESTGSFSSKDMAGYAGAAVKMNEALSFGGTFKYYYQGVDSESANAAGADLGLLYRFKNYRAGASVSNIGNKIKVGFDSFDLPMIVRAGVSGKFRDILTVSADYINYNDSGAAGAAGAELDIPLKEIGKVALRAGYRKGGADNAGSGISAGAGFAAGGLSIDYAYVPYGDLGGANRISMNFSFGAAGGEKENAKRTSEKDIRKSEKKAAAVKDVKKENPEKKKKASGSKKAQSGDSIYFLW